MIDALSSQRRPPTLIRVLWLVAAAAIIYLSLYPLAGWRLSQPSMWSYLGHGLPRFHSYVDIAANIAAYVVYGLLFALGWFSRRRPWLTVALATLTGLFLSLLMEGLQSYLPSRVPSMLDVATNLIGALLGAVLGAAVGTFRSRSRKVDRVAGPQVFEQGPALGWVLLIIWIITQLPTQRLLFSTGHLSAWSGLTLPGIASWVPALPDGAFPEALRSMLETGVVAAMIGLIGVLVMDLVRHAGARIAWISALLTGGLLLRSIASTHVYAAGPFLPWLTSGAQAGIVVGALTLYLIGAFRRRTRLAAGVALVVLGLLLINLAPADPYFQTTLASPKGALAPAITPSLRSLVGALAAFWPLLALVYFLARIYALQPRSANRASVRFRP